MTKSTKIPFLSRNHLFSTACAVGILTGAVVAPSEGAIIYAAGRNLSDSSYPTGSYYYEIDTDTGLATRISPLLAANGPNGLAAVGSQIVGFSNGTHGVVNPVTGTFTPVGTSNGLGINGYEVLNGSGYGVPNSGADRRLFQIDINTSAATAIGVGNPIGAAMDTFYGNTAGTNSPTIISLGSVGGTLYGVNTEANKMNLVAINPSTGEATIIGAPNAVATSGTPGARYNGFAALTGVDEDGDNVYDSLYGGINFYDPDGTTGPAPDQNFGGVIRFDLNNGTWSLVGNNPGVIFFSFASPTAAVPEPGTVAMAVMGLALAGGVALRRRRK